MGCSDCPDPREDKRGTRSSHDVQTNSGGQVNPPAEPEGRALFGNGRGLHRRTHPSNVEGCFACKVLGLSFGIRAGNSARGDGISISSALKEEARARVEAEPDRYAPASSRWI